MRYHRRGDNGTPDLFDSTTSYRDEVQSFVAEWNNKLWLPKIIITDRQCKLIRNALQRPFFSANWRASFKILARSKWLINDMRPKFSLDWFLNSDNFDKVMEEKYVTEKDEKPITHQVIRNGDDEEIL